MCIIIRALASLENEKSTANFSPLHNPKSVEMECESSFEYHLRVYRFSPHTNSFSINRAKPIFRISSCIIFLSPPFFAFPFFILLWLSDDAKASRWAFGFDTLHNHEGIRGELSGNGPRELICKDAFKMISLNFWVSSKNGRGINRSSVY